MKAAIAIDNWKFPIFKRHLDEAGLSFKDESGLTEDSRLLTVETDVDSIGALQAVVVAANNEARRSKMN